MLLRYLIIVAYVLAFIVPTVHAESRVLVPITEETPRNGEGSMLALKDGSLLLIYTQWYGAKGDDHDPARLVAIRSKDGGATWSEPGVVQENVGEMNVMSASLVRAKSGKLLLVYIRIDSNRFANLWYKESMDEGVTWSDPIQLSKGTDGLIFAVNQAAIRLKSGRILVAGYGGPSAWQADEHFTSYAYFTDDEGATWTKSSNEVDCPKRGAMEPFVVELSDGRLMMLMRTQMTKMYRSYSLDQGATWSASEETEITHPEAPIHIVTRPETSELVMIWNNASVAGADHQGPRTPLTLALSRDDGKTWEGIRDIESDPEGSFCYVSSAFVEDTLHLAYYGPGGLLYQRVSLSPTAAPRVFHVAPDGANNAFETLEEARDAIRAEKAAGALEGGAEVRIHGGDYLRTEPFVLGPEDSGTATAPIRYIADTGDTARLLGGRIIGGFEPVGDENVIKRLDESARSQVRQVNLKALGIEDYGSPAGGGIELFFDGQRMTLARWPNEEFATIVDVVEQDGHQIHGQKGSLIGKFVYDDPRPERWVEEADAWLHGYWFWDWAEERHPISAIDLENKMITVKEPYHNYGYRKGQWYYAYNLISELDAPGEWYLDRETGVLYFWPPRDPATVEVMVTLLPTLVTLKDASHVTMQGLILEGARSTMASVQNGEGVRLNALTVRNGGGSAISVGGGKNNGVQGCDIYGMGGGGISINGGDRTTLTPANHFAMNNHIHDFAQVKRVYQAGVHVNGVGNHVANNHIHDAPHMAIGFGGNDHIIELNEIHDVCLESNDAGAMYTGRNWTMRGHIIRHNSLYDINGFRNNGCVGVYLDDMFSSAEIYGNIFRNVYRAAFIGGGRDCTVENNIFINCNRALHIDARALGWAHGHADEWIAEEAEKGTISGVAYNKPPYSERYPELVTIIENDPKAPVGNLIARNIFVGEGWKDVEGKADPYITYTDNLTDTDPLFVDSANHDYRLRPESPVIKLGFQVIPIDKIGLYESRLRASWPAK